MSMHDNFGSAVSHMCEIMLRYGFLCENHRLPYPCVPVYV